MKKSKNQSDRVFTNYSIRAPEVRCIDDKENNLGVMNTKKAIALAEKAGLDLVIISNAKIPVCKILDAGKYKYNLSKKKKEQMKKQKESSTKVKEVKFRPTTDSHDLKTKAKQAEKFLSDGCQVKVSINFKGREMSHQEVAQGKLDEFISMLNSPLDIFEEPKISGKQMTCIISPKKELSKAG